jgi:hypothetical protein
MMVCCGDEAEYGTSCMIARHPLMVQGTLSGRGTEPKWVFLGLFKPILPDDGEAGPEEEGKYADAEADDD